ncbi:MAG: RluA family pseudouridine synthase [Chitinophagales bacterium]|nr:RluA family pseudouridine synthase [Chitinophagales bacterium]
MKPINIEVIYEDEDILVVNKPSGCLVLPDRIKSEDWNIKAHFEKQYPNIFIVHRIDRDTSGVLILAKNAAAHKHLSLQFQERKTAKNYIALVHGRMQVKAATLTLKIAENKAHRGRYLIHKSGLDAITHYQTIEEFRHYTLLDIQIETGRTHQIRVHMQAIQHPLAIDPIYGLPEKTGIFLSEIKKHYKPNKEVEEERPLINRLTLHASKLTITHPTTNEVMILEADLPKDFQLVLKHLRSNK